MNKPLEKLASALDRLREAVALDVSDIVRDGANQRFEFCFELSWKAVQQRARQDGVDCAPPRDCFRFAWRQGWVEEEPVLAMISYLNLTEQVFRGSASTSPPWRRFGDTASLEAALRVTRETL